MTMSCASGPMLDRRREKELPPGDVWYWHLCDNRDNGPFLTEEGALQSARRAIDLDGPND
jgi:hypothetical protein